MSFLVETMNAPARAPKKRHTLNIAPPSIGDADQRAAASITSKPRQSQLAPSLVRHLPEEGEVGISQCSLRLI